MISNLSIQKAIEKLDMMTIELKKIYPNHKILFKLLKFNTLVIAPWMEYTMNTDNEESVRYNEEVMNGILEWINSILNILKNNKSMSENIMKKSQLKTLIKEVIKEFHQTKQSSDIYEGYSVNLGPVVIPGISTENDEVEVMTSIEYESESAEPASGMFGPPEHSSPGHGASIDVLDYWVTDVLVYSAESQGQKKEYDFKTLKPEQQQSVKDALIAYIEENEDKVGQDIMDKLSSNEPYYPEPERNEKQ